MLQGSYCFLALCTDDVNVTLTGLGLLERSSVVESLPSWIDANSWEGECAGRWDSLEEDIGFVLLEHPSLSGPFPGLPLLATLR